MALLVLTIVGDDRAGLVAALAEVVSAHDGNWERSQLAELAGAFAGIVEVSVPDDRAAALRAAVEGLDGMLKVTTHEGTASTPRSARTITLDVLGNDHPGIVREISAALGRHQLSIERMDTRTLEAPMSGGLLFEATAVATIPASAELAAVRADLERIAAEVQVDITFAD